MKKNDGGRRVKGSGSLFKRNGKFVYQWRCQTGKIKTKTLYASKRTDAEKEVAEIVQEEQRLALIDSKIVYMQEIAEAKELLRVCRVPLSKLEDAFFEHPSAPTITPAHRKNYHSTLSAFVSFALAQQKINTVADVTSDTAQAFLTWYWKRGVAPKTFNGTLDILKRVFRTMNKDGNPFEEFKKKQNTPEERSAFTVEQLERIWQVLSSPSYYMLYKTEMIALYKLALYTGARCGDLCLLKWSSVDMEHRIIRFMPHKTSHSSRKVVEIPIATVLYEALSGLKQINEYVLPNVANRYQYNPGGIGKDTKKLLLASGLTPNDAGTTRRIRSVARLCFHGFRHTAASLLIKNGVNPLIVRDMLGHASIEMTSHYTHIDLSSKAQALKTLPIIGECRTPDHGSQSIPFAELFVSLSRDQLAALGVWLETHLSTDEATELRNILKENLSGKSTS